MRHWEKSKSLVCGLIIAVGIMAMEFWVSASWVLKYSQVKAGEPTGGSKEAEAGGVNKEGWAQDIYVIWFGRILGDGVSDGSG